MIDLNPACRHMTDVLAGITDGRLSDPTPCAKYTVADVVDHVDYGAVQFIAIAHHDGEQSRTDAGPAGTQGGPGRRDLAGAHVKALGEAWDSPRAWQGSTTLAGY